MTLCTECHDLICKILGLLAHSHHMVVAAAFFRDDTCRAELLLHVDNNIRNRILRSQFCRFTDNVIAYEKVPVPSLHVLGL